MFKRPISSLLPKLPDLLLLCAFLFLTIKAVFEFHPFFDLLDYHLPKALGYFGMISFTGKADKMSLMAGHPPLAFWLKGLLVWLTGRLSSQGVLGILGVALASGVIRSYLGLLTSLRWMGVLLLSVPLLVIHLEGCDIDVWAGCGLLIAFAGYYRMESKADVRRGCFAFQLGCAIAMYSKLTTWLPALILSSAFFVSLIRKTRTREVPFRFGMVNVIVLFVILAGWPVRNWIEFKNPVYPFQVPLIERHLPGYSQQEYEQSRVGNRPDYLKDADNSRRFFDSVFELDRLMPSIPHRYQISQSDPISGKSPHNKMGGWGVWTVVTLLWWIGFATAKRAFPDNPVFVLSLMILINSLVPQSHELRYLFYIPLCAILLASIALENTTLPFQRLARAGFICCALFSLFQLRSLVDFSPYTISFAPAASYAPLRAKQFWSLQESGRSRIEPVEICGVNSLVIFWAGPTFSEHQIIGCGWPNSRRNSFLRY